MQKRFLWMVVTMAVLYGSNVSALEPSISSQQASDHKKKIKQERRYMTEYTQVICTRSKIKEGCIEEVKAWLQTLEQKRRSETLESFHNEGIWIESAFIQEDNGVYFLIYFMRAEDIKQAMSVFQESELPIDDFHKQCWMQFTKDHEILTPIFHLEAEKPS